MKAAVVARLIICSTKYVVRIFLCTPTLIYLVHDTYVLHIHHASQDYFIIIPIIILQVPTK